MAKTGLGKNNKKGGNQSKELYELIALNKIVTAIAGIGGIPSPSGLATESTLISVLNAIMSSHQDIEILLVRDTGNNNQVIQQITDYQSGVPTIIYKDVNNNIYTPIGTLEYLDPSSVLNLILSELVTLNTKDFATETTLASILSNTTSLNGKDFSTETTLVALLTAFNNEDFSTETTLNNLLTAFNSEDFASETTLNNLANTDFATETTLAEINNKLQVLGQHTSAESMPVVLSTEQENILGDIQNKLNSLNLKTGVLAKYAIAREDTTSISQKEYYGFKDVTGAWYILEIDLTNGAYYYANGAAGTFETAWAQAQAGTLITSEFENLIW